MDLLKLLKEALRDPFKIKSAFVIFVNVFFVLIVGLTLLSTLHYLGLDLTPTGACNEQKTKKLDSTISKNREAVYEFKYTGNKYCFLSAYVTWDDPTNSIDFWIYNPSGKVNVYQANNKFTHNLVYLPSPLEQGKWRIVLKTENSNVDFTGEIKLR